MSFSMSPPQKPQPPSQGPYPPHYQGSPPNAASSPYAPPPKRQKLSPDPRSPTTNGAVAPTSANTQHSIPPSPGSYGNPYAPSGAQSSFSPTAYTTSPQNSFNSPQPYPSHPSPWPAQAQSPAPRQPQFNPSPAPPSSQMMPPPPRPSKEDKDEKAGVEDIGDSLFGSGIDLKAEENYLHSTWTNRHGMSDSFNTVSSGSFGSNAPNPNNSFGMLQNGTSFGPQAQEGAFAGTMGAIVSQEDVEAELKRKRELAAQRKAERDQHHLNNQFLLGNCLRNRMHKRAFDAGVKLDVQGVYLRTLEPKTQVAMNGSGTEGIVASQTKPESIIEAGAQYEHILSLVSLATSERLRGLVNDAYGLARARQYGDHGRVVPPEFADIAAGEGKKTQDSVVPENISGTQWDRLPENGSGDVNGEPLKDSSATTPQPLHTISFESSLTSRLRDLAEYDKRAEKERAKKREARKRRAENGELLTPVQATGTGTDTPAEDGSNTVAGTPAAEPSSGPVDAAAPTKISKKEANKKSKEAASSEAQAFNQSNQTAAMMALGRKGNKYSWMSGGASNIPTNRFAKAAAAASGSGGANASSGVSINGIKQEPGHGGINAAGPASAQGKADRGIAWGDWREDSVNGKGIQLRDWATVLERDGKVKRAWQKLANKLS